VGVIVSALAAHSYSGAFDIELLGFSVQPRERHRPFGVRRSGASSDWTNIPRRFSRHGLTATVPNLVAVHN
jgi:hypothetical protein